MTKKTSKEMWSKILKPPCFGQWDCAIHPNANNPYFPTDPNLPKVKIYSDFERLRESCMWAKKCATIVVGRKNANKYFPSHAP